MITCAVAGGSTRSANTRSDPVIWLASAAAIPRSSRKATESDRTGTPRGGGNLGVDAREQQRTGDQAERDERGDRHREQRQHLRVRDPEEAAEEQARDAVEDAAVEAHEEEAAGQRERLHGADHGGFLAVSARTRRVREAIAMMTAAATQKPK